MAHSAPRIATIDGIADEIAALLGSMLVETVDHADELSFTVVREELANAMVTLRDMGHYQQLMEIAGVDYPDRAERFEVCYHLLSVTRNHRIRVKVSTDENMPVPTVTHIWPVAGWLEREVFDMYGVIFDGNTDLRRILTDYGFEGHPFRKDFPITGYVELRYSQAEKRVVYEPVELSQEMRTFDFLSPWEGADYVLPGDEKAHTPPVDEAKTTDSPKETGAGRKTDEKADEKVSEGAPAEEKTGEDRTPAPEPTEDRKDRPERKGDTKDTAAATQPEGKSTDKD